MTADIGRLYNEIREEAICTNNLYTIGQVSEITGIEKRTIKYYVERQIISPSNQKIEGEGGKKYWLYTKTDIFKIRQIALYRELGYSTDEIRKMFSAPDFNWHQALDNQIEALKGEKKHLENLIIAAEIMRYEDSSEFDISDFDNDIDGFVADVFSYDEEELASQSIEKVSKDFSEVNIAEMLRQGQQMMDVFYSLQKVMIHSPESNETQDSLSEMFSYFQSLAPDADLDIQEILLGFLLVSNLSMDRIFDILFSHEGASDYWATALKKYCDDHMDRRN